MSYDDPQWPAIIKKGEALNIERNVLISLESLKNWTNIKKNHAGNYYMTSMFRAIYSLALTPGGRGIGSQLKTFGPISVFYSVAPNGDVKIKLLSINEEPKRFVKNDPGLYQVAWDDSEKAWFPKERLESAMDLNHQWSGAHSAAIVGKFENATQAGERIIIHITNAYKSAFSASEIQQPGKHFSLYWMNNDFDSKQDVESIVSLIQNAQTEKANIRWLIHGEGAGVFVKAMQYMLDNPRSVDIHSAQKGLQSQMVYFSNPRGKNTSERDLKNICEKVGLNYLGTNPNLKDLIHSKDAREAFMKEVLPVIAPLSLGGTLDSITGFDNITKIIELLSGTPEALAVAGICFSGYVLGKGLASQYSGYGRNVKGFIGSSFGDENQKWQG